MTFYVDARLVQRIPGDRRYYTADAVTYKEVPDPSRAAYDAETDAHAETLTPPFEDVPGESSSRRMLRYMDWVDKYGPAISEYRMRRLGERFAMERERRVLACILGESPTPDNPLGYE